MNQGNLKEQVEAGDRIHAEARHDYKAAFVKIAPLACTVTDRKTSVAKTQSSTIRGGGALKKGTERSEE